MSMLIAPKKQCHSGTQPEFPEYTFLSCLDGEFLWGRLAIYEVAGQVILLANWNVF